MAKSISYFHDGEKLTKRSISRTLSSSSSSASLALPNLNLKSPFTAAAFRDSTQQAGALLDILLLFWETKD